MGCRFAAHVFRFRYSNALSYDNLLAFLETTAYHAYNFKSLLCIVSECYAGGVFIPFFFLFFTIALATISQQHLGLSGTLEVALKSLAFLSIIYIMLFIHLIEAGRVYFLDIKLYSIYIPSVVNSITISLDYLTAAFVFLVVAIGFAATVYARVYLYGDPQTPDFLIKLL